MEKLSANNYEKFFIITVDTESDNQWNLNQSQTTENALYIPRFQELCEDFGYRPTYLVDYSMAHSVFLSNYLKAKNKLNQCEIGTHLHAWDTPPVFSFPKEEKGRPFIIEYPDDVMEEKVFNITKKVEEVFESKMRVHRAGRWAINEKYIRILEKYGYLVDCSITPGITWKKQKGAFSGGPNYKRVSRDAFRIYNTSILEVPMTIRKMHVVSHQGSSFLQKIRGTGKAVLGTNIWLRPALFLIDELEKLVSFVDEEGSDYLEFMIHSSELMPNGSPYYKSQDDIEALYGTLRELFSFIANSNYKGCTLLQYNDYFNKYRCRREIL